MNYNQLVTYLSQKKLLNLLLLIIYYLLVVLPHEQVGVFVAKIFDGVERPIYDLIILCIALLLFGFLVSPLTIKIFQHSQKKIILLYLISTIFLAALCFNVLFVANIEVVHFFQYAAFALLCYPLTLNYNQTMIISTLAGTLDEAYQYFYLAPLRTDYFDFNDVVTNLIGVAFGLIIIKIFNPFSKTITLKTFFKSPASIFLLLITAITLIAIITNLLGIYHTNTEAQFLLVKKPFDSFWTTLHPNITYHVMLPLEGLLATISLWLFYKPLGSRK